MGGRLVWAVCGVAAAAVAIGVGEIVAALLGSGSIISAVGALVISLQPPGAKDLMVTLFGENDKLALVHRDRHRRAAGGSASGPRRRGVTGPSPSPASCSSVSPAFVLLQGDPLNGTDRIERSPPIAAVLAGAGTLAVVVGRTLLRLVDRDRPNQRPDLQAPPMDRRGFLALSAMFIAAGGVLAVIGRYLGGSVPEAASPADVPIPVPAGTDLGIAGLTPIVVPNSSFYRIDTRLDVPRVDETTWNLRIHGMVDREVTLTYADLQQMAQQDQFVTIACVSNDVGGRLVGNALWSGVQAHAGARDGGRAGRRRRSWSADRSMAGRPAFRPSISPAPGRTR